MIVILWAFTLFHVAVGSASLGMASAPADAEGARALALAIGAAGGGVSVLDLSDRGLRRREVRVDARIAAGQHHAIPMLLAPILWLVLMGLLFAIVDFAEDGVLGNARKASV